MTNNDNVIKETFYLIFDATRNLFVAGSFRNNETWEAVPTLVPKFDNAQKFFTAKEAKDTINNFGAYHANGLVIKEVSCVYKIGKIIQ